MLDHVRKLLDAAFPPRRGPEHRALRLARELVGTANDLVVRPLSRALHTRRRRARAAAAPAGREPAPVMVYFDGQDHRTLAKLEELLRARDIPYRVLDVADDEASRSWASTAARRADFPLLFIAGEPIGGLHEATQLDVNGGLKRRVFA
jgi:hypothetical protein